MSDFSVKIEVKKTIAATAAINKGIKATAQLSIQSTGITVTNISGGNAIDDNTGGYINGGYA